MRGRLFCFLRGGIYLYKAKIDHYPTIRFMKKTCLFSTITTCHRQELIRIKARAGILLLLATLFAQPGFCQKVCDTLFTTSGAQVLIEIVQTYKHGIVYTKCEDQKDFRYYTISDEIVKIRYQNPGIRSAKILREKKKSNRTGRDSCFG